MPVLYTVAFYKTQFAIFVPGSTVGVLYGLWHGLSNSWVSNGTRRLFYLLNLKCCSCVSMFWIFTIFRSWGRPKVECWRFYIASSHRVLETTGIVYSARSNKTWLALSSLPAPNCSYGSNLLANSIFRGSQPEIRSLMFFEWSARVPK